VRVDFAKYTAVEVERDGPILRVWFNRPDQLNAINRDVHAELETLFFDIDRDDQTRVAVISGRGRAFSAGGDLDWLLELNADPAASARAIRADRIIQTALLSLETPLIAKVNGPAVGLGCSLALYCDFVVSTPGAVFVDPHVSVGLVAGDGGALIWPQLIGFMQARRYLLSGDPITGVDAQRLGLITETAETSQLNDAVDIWVQKLLARPDPALRWTKLSINGGLRAIASSVLDSAAGFENLTQILPEHREALQALRNSSR
jgi:enoyl-CoA hydratase